MQLYTYEVKNPQGKTIKGLIEAINEKQAVLSLRERGYFILKVAKKQDYNLSLITKYFQRAKSGDIVNFTQELSTMVMAGLPLTEGIDILRRQTRNADMVKILTDILDKVQGGSSLADALMVHPRLFSKVYVALIRSGESAGVLDKILSRLADNLEKNREFQGKVKGAMVYPIIIITAMIVVVFIMMIFVIPKLTSLYKDFGTDLPLPTKILMGTSDFFVKFSPLLVLMLIGLFFGYKAWSKTASGRRKMDEILLKIPIMGKITSGMALTEFSRTLGLLMMSGIPILNGLNIVAEAMGNRVYEDAIKDAAKEVEKGFPLGVPISRNPDFPIILGQMLKVGEESGKMDQILEKLSHYFEAETEQLVKGLTTAIEPLIMILLGVGVGFLVMAIILPIYNLTSQF